VGTSRLATKAVTELLVGALVGFVMNVAFMLMLARLYDENVMARVKRVE
jgi:hypothetical protein